MPSSVECLSYLEEISLSYCKRLKSLPSSVCNLSFLKWLDLCSCSMLEYFPELLKPMERFEYLNLSETSIRELHSSISNLICISSLYLHKCDNLEVVPDTIFNAHLQTLSFSDCPRLAKLPPLSIVLHLLTSLHVKNCYVFAFLTIFG